VSKHNWVTCWIFNNIYQQQLHVSALDPSPRTRPYKTRSRILPPPPFGSILLVFVWLEYKDSCHTTWWWPMSKAETCSCCCWYILLNIQPVTQLCLDTHTNTHISITTADNTTGMTHLKILIINFLQILIPIQLTIQEGCLARASREGRFSFTPSTITGFN
jgi:hypothetical protein